jgi:hypothetical protein
MKLTTGWGETIHFPSEREIETLLEDMPGGLNSFVILEKAPGQYIQAAGGESSLVQIEYQAGGLEQHYRCTDAADIDKTIQIFLAYARNEANWVELANWEWVDLNLKPTSLKRTFPKKATSQDPKKPNTRRNIIIGLLVFTAIALGIFGGLMENYEPGQPLFNSAKLAITFIVIILVLTLVVGIFWFSPRAEEKKQAALTALKLYGIATPGRIVGVKRSVRHDEDMPTTILYYIFFHYDTPRGRQVKKYAVEGLALYSIGDTLTVKYDPDKPKNAIIHNHKKKTQWKGWQPAQVEKPHWRKGVNIGLLIGLITSGLFTLLQIVTPFLNLPDPLWNSIHNMGCCLPARFVIWSGIGMAAYSVMSSIYRHQQVLAAFQSGPAPKAYFEATVNRTLVACPHCDRYNYPETGRCPYCAQIVNMGRRGMFFSGAAILLAVLGLIFVFGEAAKIDFEVVIFLLLLLGLGTYNLIISIRENRFWISLQSSQKSL